MIKKKEPGSIPPQLTFLLTNIVTVKVKLIFGDFHIFVVSDLGKYAVSICFCFFCLLVVCLLVLKGTLKMLHLIKIVYLIQKHKSSGNLPYISV